MTDRAESPSLTISGNHMMRRALNDVEHIRGLATRFSEETRSLRENVRKTHIDAERDARARVNAFSPRDIGEELRLDLKHKFGLELPRRRDPAATPATFEAAEKEWAGIAAAAERDVQLLISAKKSWDEKRLKRGRSMPTVPARVWASADRLSEIYAALPALRERYVTQRLDGNAHLNDELAVKIEARTLGYERALEEVRGRLRELDESIPPNARPWTDSAWLDAKPAAEMQRVIRIGEFAANLPQGTGIGHVPALLDFPLRAGVAIAADVAHRAEAINLARSLALRSLASIPAGSARFVFVDPVSLGQSVADFRHLAEFDERLVDARTWTSERDIESRLEELSDHLQVVISTYLRGQFESIDEYNVQAGEVAEPYRVLVVFDYPSGFSGRAARQLLSLIENGSRCGVHTILVHDPSRSGPEELRTDRMVHSMQRIDLTERAGVTLLDPIGKVGLQFLPDTCPQISFSPDGQATSTLAELLNDVGIAARGTESGAVTLQRVVPIINRLVTAGRAQQVPSVPRGALPLDTERAETWWQATTSHNAYAPIGRAGAQDVAALYFSSTEIAGGAIVIGLPRSGKTTALHAAIVSLSMLYSPDELELYLVDSKHGVEFKIYDRLPHARLVSINSERAFSVSVLESLASEIKRRAELMKRRTVGKANITEYREATGERLPRIVLFMDEFHELFEEDDALGQAAFHAFSNIVKQGSFAGVHVVVASQTLSRMPAMDRGTLTLLPMRVAFTCNDSDADLVMGDANREVRALSQQGEGIFNPARGDPSYNKPFRGLYIPPNERDSVLSRISTRADQQDFQRRPKVFDGDTPADRRPGPPPGNPTKPVIALGEPFNLEEWAGVSLRRGRGANALVVGAGDADAEQVAGDVAAEGALHSCVVDAALAGLAVHVVDFVGDTDEGDALSLLNVTAAVGARYRRAAGLGDVLSGLTAEVESRRDAAAYDLPGQLLVLAGIERALDLVPEDRYDDGPGQQIASALGSLLRDGPEVGCHVVAVVDRLSQFERRMGREALKEFDWRVVGSDVSPADVATLSESHREPEIRESQLLIVDNGRGRNRRVRAYPPHTLATVPAPNRQDEP